MRKPTHPWRASAKGEQNNDPVATGRSSRFSAYLSTLGPAERKRIEDAERNFVLTSGRLDGARAATARDYADSMVT